MGPNRFAFLRNGRAAILTALLALQAAGLHGVSRKEIVPAARPLAEVPGVIGTWRMAQEIPLDEETLAELRADDTMSRYYVNAEGSSGANLFVAWFASQRTGRAPHSPKNCLPGSGWTPSESDVLSVAVPGEVQPVRVNRYVVSKGEQKSVVLYWYQSRGRTIASEYEAKIRLVADAIRYNRTDTALVRIVVPVRGAADSEATAAAEDLLRAAYPILRRHLPS